MSDNRMRELNRIINEITEDPKKQQKMWDFIRQSAKNHIFKKGELHRDFAWEIETLMRNYGVQGDYKASAKEFSNDVMKEWLAGLERVISKWDKR